MKKALATLLLRVLLGSALAAVLNLATLFTEFTFPVLAIAAVALIVAIQHDRELRGARRHVASLKIGLPSPDEPPRAGMLVLELLAKRRREALIGELESYYRTRGKKYGLRIAKRLFYWHVIRSVFFAPVGTLIQAAFPIKLSISTGRSKEADDK